MHCNSEKIINPTKWENRAKKDINLILKANRIVDNLFNYLWNSFTELFATQIKLCVKPF